MVTMKFYSVDSVDFSNIIYKNIYLYCLNKNFKTKYLDFKNFS